ncbi:MAG: tyrosinase family protein [Ruegeria sp.]
MSRFTRRTAIGLGVAGIATGTLKSFPEWMARADDYPGTRIRYDAASPEGKEQLKIYARGVANMKATAEGNPMSWMFQWYTHWVNPNTNKEQEIDRIYGAASSADKMLALAMWDTCRGHITWAGQRDWFTPWHRMYVLFFEQIIRAAAREPEFTLPYWDYTTPGKRAIPEELRMEDDPVFGSLFVGKRNPGVNDGVQLDQTPLYPQLEQSIGQDPLGLDCLDIMHFRDQAPASGFNANLDMAPHGMVHVLVGNGQNMGSVPWAASDPVFWLHHANVDRIWASWNAAGGGRENPSDDTWNDMMFTFSDDRGQQVLAKTSDFVATEPLGYEYQELLTPPGVAPVVVAQADTTESVSAAPSPASQRLELGQGEASVAVELPAGTEETIAAGSQRTYLVLADLRIDAQPGVLYSVFLQPSADTTEGRKAVGVLNFFNAPPKDLELEGATPAFYSIDVTDTVAGFDTTQAPIVTIAPTGTPAADAAPVVGEVYFATR